ncbi:glycosyltransferase family 4 protein [Uliginosibacterium aquaticum]|uniref:Glycosyltransferase family 4 protein n=1 Tax=Uliginosibacterium aquaticum TaxID=2731212 RepID=A0ABX2IGL4_9RHOO|nr:glycosyltransferase family 1 protein [Uliginosibacterium aquaticum]NSL53754.1 glycosyltransferase family 4 protein [Uliginosibacterium aquaticum]
MRIVVDMQGAQTGSRFRGIGRYSLALTKAMLKEGRGHEFILLLNGLLDESIPFIRSEFRGLLPNENIRVWNSHGPVYGFDSRNSHRKNVAELIRESYISGLKPDVLLITSMVEGFGDNAVHSVGRIPSGYATAAIFYDAIPLIQSDVYLKPNPDFEPLYREKIDYLGKADLLLAISESSRGEAISYLGVAESSVVNISAAVDDGFGVMEFTSEAESEIRKKFGLDRPFLMYSGATDDRKNHFSLFDAYASIRIDLRRRYQLAIVGGMPEDHLDRFFAYIGKKGLSRNDVRFTGRVSDDELVALYNLCHLYVFPSLHEGFGLPALEAMSCGAPVIGSNLTSIPEVIGTADAYFDPSSITSIARKIEEYLLDDDKRLALRSHGIEQAKKFSWENCARRALGAMEACVGYPGLLEKIGDSSEQEAEEGKLIRLIADESRGVSRAELAGVALAIARNEEPDFRRLFIDVSEMVQRDSRTGIQRVVRSILKCLLESPPDGFVVEPVFATEDGVGYRYANRYKHVILGDGESLNDGKPIDFSRRDVFVCLDMQHNVQPAQRGFYAKLRASGVKTVFVLYDLLPIYMPQFFPADTYSDHSRWLGVVAEFDQVVCISKAVASDFEQWIIENKPESQASVNIEWFHIGADIDASVPTAGVSEQERVAIQKLSTTRVFLTVGTLEPRKFQTQVLGAFEILWSRGLDLTLVIVGKQGWDVLPLVSRIKDHERFGEQLFWFDSISDECLANIYESSDCLIAASMGEGFGLPLIEAAQSSMPIIARDIPVFKEVAGDFAFYFSGVEDIDLAEAVQTWCDLYDTNRAPSSKGMKWSSWEQSTQRLVSLIGI